MEQHSKNRFLSFCSTAKHCAIKRLFKFKEFSASKAFNFSAPSSVPTFSSCEGVDSYWMESCKYEYYASSQDPSLSTTTPEYNSSPGSGHWIRPGLIIFVVYSIGILLK